MFKFDFELDDDEVDISNNLNLAVLNISGDEQLEISVSAAANKPIKLEPFIEISLSQLIDALPPVISYSPISIPLSSGAEPLRLGRRDLFDARFQLISEGRDESDTLRFFEMPSDLVPGVYEGGFKTWECSLDLVDYMESNKLVVIGKKALEVWSRI